MLTITGLFADGGRIRKTNGPDRFRYAAIDTDTPVFSWTADSSREDDVQTACRDLFLAELKRGIVLFPDLLVFPAVLVRCLTDDRLKRLHHFFVLHKTHAEHRVTEFYAAGGLHDKIVALLYVQVGGIEIISFPARSEFYSYYFYHMSSVSDAQTQLF